MRACRTRSGSIGHLLVVLFIPRDTRGSRAPAPLGIPAAQSASVFPRLDRRDRSAGTSRAPSVRSAPRGMPWLVAYSSHLFARRLPPPARGDVHDASTRPRRTIGASRKVGRRIAASLRSQTTCSPYISYVDPAARRQPRSSSAGSPCGRDRDGRRTSRGSRPRVADYLVDHDSDSFSSSSQGKIRPRSPGGQRSLRVFFVRDLLCGSTFAARGLIVVSVVVSSRNHCGCP